MKTFVRLSLCLTIALFAIARAAAPVKAKPSVAPAKTEKKESAEAATAKVDAKGALAGARKALAAMVKAAREDTGLDPKTPKNKPFWSATRKLSTQLDKAQKGFAAKNDDFFKGVSEARSAEEQMKVDWQLTDSKNKEVIEAGKKLGHALAILRTDFSKEAARKKKGGELTAKEKEQFAKIKKQQTELLGKVKALRAIATKDKGLEHGLQKIETGANRVVKAPETVDGFIATLYLLDELEGLLYGYDYYVDKDWRNNWVNVATWTSSWDPYVDSWSPAPYVWVDATITVNIPAEEDFTVSEDLSEPEIEAQDDFAENEPVDMSEPEREEVAQEEDSDAEVEADDAEDDDDSMEDSSDEEGEDFDGESDDDGGGTDDDDDGGDDAGNDDGGDEGGE